MAAMPLAVTSAASPRLDGGESRLQRQVVGRVAEPDVAHLVVGGLVAPSGSSPIGRWGSPPPRRCWAEASAGVQQVGVERLRIGRRSRSSSSILNDGQGRVRSSSRDRTSSGSGRVFPFDEHGHMGEGVAASTGRRRRSASRSRSYCSAALTAGATLHGCAEPPGPRAASRRPGPAGRRRRAGPPRPLPGQR